MIDEWEQKFGGNEKFVDSARPGQFDYDLGVAYPIEVSKACVMKTKRGDVCLQLDVDVLQGEEVVGKDRQWITLPKQASDSDRAVDQVRRITHLRRDDVIRILSAAPEDGAAYRKYASRKSVDGKFIYFDADGSEMSSADFKEREKTINARAMETCDHWHEDIGLELPSLHTAKLYLAKTPNKKNANYPYTNYFVERPETLPVFGEGDSDTPF